MKEQREHNECLLLNILPAHVAQHFLQRDTDNEVTSSCSRRMWLLPEQISTKLTQDGFRKLPLAVTHVHKTLLKLKNTILQLYCFQ